MVFGLDWGLGLGLWWYLGGSCLGKSCWFVENSVMAPSLL